MLLVSFVCSLRATFTKSFVLDHGSYSPICRGVKFYFHPSVRLRKLGRYNSYLSSFRIIKVLFEVRAPVLIYRTFYLIPLKPTLILCWIWDIHILFFFFVFWYRVARVQSNRPQSISCYRHPTGASYFHNLKLSSLLSSCGCHSDVSFFFRA